MFCDIVLPDGRRPTPTRGRCSSGPWPRPRTSGFAFYTHPEIEFFLFRDQPGDGRPPTPVDQGGYFDHIAHGIGHDFRRDAITMLENMGISVEFSHHEGAPGQQEIDLRYADALSTADNIMTFRHVMKEVALSQGVYASFMPKPFTDHPGSGMHTHLSLFEGDRNAFFEAGSPYQLSKVGAAFIAGLLRHAGEITAVTNQWVNSYKRLLGGGEAPAYVCWGHNNRSALVRVPMYKPAKGQSTRVELRTPDSAANPYLAFAVMLAAGLKGIEEGYELPEAAEDDVWALTDGGAPGAGHRAAADQPVRGHPPDGGQRAGRRDAGRARLRLLPAQQAGRVGRLPPRGHPLRARPVPARAVICSIVPMTYGRRVLVVQHEAGTGAGWFGGWLTGAGLDPGDRSTRTPVRTCRR